MPAIIWKQKFVKASDAAADGLKFARNVDYQEREKAVAISANPDAAPIEFHGDQLGYQEREAAVAKLLNAQGDVIETGIFYDSTNAVTDADRRKYREYFTAAQESGQSMQLSFISFETEFLVENNLLIDGQLQLGKLKDAVRAGMNELIDKSYLGKHPGNAVWTAAIHTNTEHVHIHVSLVEKTKVHRLRDVLEKEAIEKAKSMIARALSTNPHLAQLSKLWKERALPKFMETLGHAQRDQLEQLMQQLPPEYKTYNSKKYAKYKPLLDQYIDQLILSDPELKAASDEYKSLLEKHEEYSKKIYGAGNLEQYKDAAENKMRDEYYSDTGNKVLKHLAALRNGLALAAADAAEQVAIKTLPDGTVSDPDPTGTILSPDLYKIRQAIFSDRLLLSELTEQLAENIRLDAKYEAAKADLPPDLLASLKAAAQQYAGQEEPDSSQTAAVENTILSLAYKSRLEKILKDHPVPMQQLKAAVGLKNIDIFKPDRETKSTLQAACKSIRHPEISTQNGWRLLIAAQSALHDEVKTDLTRSIKAGQLTLSDDLTLEKNQQQLASFVIGKTQNIAVSPEQKNRLIKACYLTAFQESLKSMTAIAPDQPELVIRNQAKTVDLTALKAAVGFRRQTTFRPTPEVQKALDQVVSKLPFGEAIYQKRTKRIIEQHILNLTFTHNVRGLFQAAARHAAGHSVAPGSEKDLITQLAGGQAIDPEIKAAAANIVTAIKPKSRSDTAKRPAHQIKRNRILSIGHMAITRDIKRTLQEHKRHVAELVQEHEQAEREREYRMNLNI